MVVICEVTQHLDVMC